MNFAKMNLGHGLLILLCLFAANSTFANERPNYECWLGEKKLVIFLNSERRTIRIFEQVERGGQFVISGQMANHYAIEVKRQDQLTDVLNNGLPFMSFVRKSEEKVSIMKSHVDLPFAAIKGQELVCPFMENKPPAAVKRIQ